MEYIEFLERIYKTTPEYMEGKQLTFEDKHKIIIRELKSMLIKK